MKLTSDNAIFNFDKNNAPAIIAEAPISIDIETKDCFSNQLKKPDDRLESLNWEATNPATGPVYIKGAEPGDTLKVTVNKISPGRRGVVCCMENEGTLGHMINGSHTKIVDIRDGFAEYAPDIKLPLKPMIGVIGVAPAGKPVNAGTPGQHGGNMDNTMVTEGASLYFPVAAEGGGLALGDVHGVMGDGEIGVTGLEIPAEVNITVELIKGKAPEYPILENEDSFSIIVSKKTIDEAAEKAAELMLEFLRERTDMEMQEIIMLMSLAGDMQICQIVDPEKTVRFVFPKKYMKKAEF